MDAPDLPTLISLGGAAGALFYVLKLVVEGKLHTTSEVEGLREDKKALLAANGRLQAGLEKANDLMQIALDKLAAK